MFPTAPQIAHAKDQWYLLYIQPYNLAERDTEEDLKVHNAKVLGSNFGKTQL